jgi:hypothetical protein
MIRKLLWRVYLFGIAPVLFVGLAVCAYLGLSGLLYHGCLWMFGSEVMSLRIWGVAFSPFSAIWQVPLIVAGLGVVLGMGLGGLLLPVIVFGRKAAAVFYAACGRGVPVRQPLSDRTDEDRRVRSP